MIISNTTPLINFSAICRLDIPEKLFGKIFIPPAVEKELFVKGENYPNISELRKARFRDYQNNNLPAHRKVRRVFRRGTQRTLRNSALHFAFFAVSYLLGDALLKHLRSATYYYAMR